MIWLSNSNDTSNEKKKTISRAKQTVHDKQTILNGSIILKPNEINAYQII